MNTTPFFIAALMLASLSVEAGTVVSKLFIDLDQDSKADTVRIMDYGKKMNSLEIFLSRSKTSLSFDKLVKNSKTMSERYNEVDYEAGLESVTNTSFKIVGSGWGTSSRVSYSDEISIGLKSEILVVLTHSRKSSISTGDERNGQGAIYDFASHSKRIYSYNDRTDENFRNDKTEAIQDSCQVTLAELNQSGIPACAKK